MQLKVMVNRLINLLHKPMLNRYFKINKEVIFNKKSWTENRIHVYQNKKLSEILDYSIKNVPFYISRNFKSDLSCFPVMKKEDYRKVGENNFISNKSIFMAKYFMNTGGSTGRPFSFLADRYAGEIDTLHQEFNYSSIGYNKGDKIHLLTGVKVSKAKLDENIFWLERPNNLPFGTVNYSSHYLNENNLRFYVEKLNKEKPDIIRAYPSAMYFLTKLIQSSGEEINFKPKALQLTSEMAFDYQVEYIKAFWRCEVSFQYGHSEVSTFAIKEKIDSNYQFSPFYGITEILDEDNNHVKPGEVGRIVVTSLHNRVRPFIRYDTGDRAVYSGQVNGITEVKEILGRAQEFVWDKDGNKKFITTFVMGEHYKAFENIKAWQIIQCEVGKCNVMVVPDISYHDGNTNEIKEKFLKFGNVIAEVITVNEIPLSQAGKHKILIQKVSK